MTAEYWERTEVTGQRSGDGAGYTVRESMLHRRGEDALVMACRRNNRMAGCSRFCLETEEAFMIIRGKDGERRVSIPKGRGIRFEEWDW